MSTLLNSFRQHLLVRHLSPYLYPRRLPLQAQNKLRLLATMAAYAKERWIAELAVQRACLLTDKVYHSHVKGTVMKGDKSPVTSK